MAPWLFKPLGSVPILLLAGCSQPKLSPPPSTALTAASISIAGETLVGGHTFVAQLDSSGRVLLNGDTDTTLVVKVGEPAPRLKLKIAEGIVYGSVFLGKHALTVSDGATVYLWDLSTGKVRTTAKLPGTRMLTFRGFVSGTSAAHLLTDRFLYTVRQVNNALEIDAMPAKDAIGLTVTSGGNVFLLGRNGEVLRANFSKKILEKAYKVVFDAWEVPVSIGSRGEEPIILLSTGALVLLPSHRVIRTASSLFGDRTRTNERCRFAISGKYAVVTARDLIVAVDLSTGKLRTLTIPFGGVDGVAAAANDQVAVGCARFKGRVLLLKL